MELGAPFARGDAWLAAISACEKGSKRFPVMVLLDEKRRPALEPDVIGYNADYQLSLFSSVDITSCCHRSLTCATISAC